MDAEFELEVDDDHPTPEEVAACTRTLQSLDRSVLEQPHMSELLEAGLALFTREVIKRRFGEGEMVDAVAQLSQQRQTGQSVCVPLHCPPLHSTTWLLLW
jgi:hypothetical protein